MAQPVVHFEVIGTDPGMLRGYYRELFGWEFRTGDAATDAVSAPGQYGFVAGGTTGEHGINGGVGGGDGYERRVLFYVSVPDVEAALRRAEALGGSRRLGPATAPGGDLVIGQFADPEGHVIGVAGPA
ncbi:VOC family protein [Streptomyces buecherae]|uniref:VOC family protein n=1 Tax=Streptomyces buecherae TaxID=2763006 RepID=UPI003693BF3B